MARYFTSGDNEYLSVGNGIVAGHPLSISAWVYPDTDGAAIYRICAVRNAGSADGYLFRVRGDLGGDPLSAYVVNQGVADGLAESAGGVNFNAWNHAGAVFATVTSRTVYLNGTATAGDADDVTGIDAPDAFEISQATTRTWDGAIAEVAVWGAALTGAEMASLNAGANPLTIRPQSLAFYGPLWRDEDEDYVGGLSLTAHNGPTVATHPPIYGRARGRLAPLRIIPEAEIVWGHDTAVAEGTVRDFEANWTGTGEIVNAGVADTEALELNATEYMISEVTHTGAVDVTITYNVYAAGDNIDLDYRTGATRTACQVAAWNNYVAAFTSSNFVQVRVTSTL